MKVLFELPNKGNWPYMSFDATHLKLHHGGRIVPVTVIITLGINSDRRREVLGMERGTFEAERVWTAILRKLPRRDLHGVKLGSPTDQGYRQQNPTRHLAEVPGPFAAPYSHPCRQEWQARGVGLHRHRLCPGKPRSRQHPMTLRHRSTRHLVAETRRHHRISYLLPTSPRGRLECRLACHGSALRVWVYSEHLR